jgi:hypothetical protein
MIYANPPSQLFHILLGITASSWYLSCSDSQYFAIMLEQTRGQACQEEKLAQGRQDVESIECVVVFVLQSRPSRRAKRLSKLAEKKLCS